MPQFYDQNQPEPQFLALGEYDMADAYGYIVVTYMFPYNPGSPVNWHRIWKVMSN